MDRRFIYGNCMSYLPDFPDNYFDVAVVDPPYFSGPEKRGFYGRKISPIGVQRIYKVSEQWNIPNQEYFDQLFRVSKNQIVWGCNYFVYSFPPGRIVWDKWKYGRKRFDFVSYKRTVYGSPGAFSLHRKKSDRRTSSGKMQC